MDILDFLLQEPPPKEYPNNQYSEGRYIDAVAEGIADVSDIIDPKVVAAWSKPPIDSSWSIAENWNKPQAKEESIWGF